MIVAGTNVSSNISRVVIYDAHSLRATSDNQPRSYLAHSLIVVSEVSQFR